tara:strand:- start:3497 stop:5404 length:1908 start_codon:yes stop_codon:yes gene_type:complete
MKFAYQDLLYFLNEKPSKDDLSEKLFQLGHEHEIVNDIFDLEITPNRGDCLSLIGLSRDLNYFYGCKDPFKIYDEDIVSLDLNFKNLSVNSCPKITFLEIEIGQDITSYKPYLENYFSRLGNKKTNFFTDVSNYVSYERGQPTHCFDRESLGNDLTFENRTCQENFKTLLGDEIKLEDKNCIFTSEDEIISLAGVMGGESTACSKQTTKVLIECAYFHPEKIIGKSVKYNLRSDAAHKFERGVDIASQEKTLRRFISIVEEHASIKSISMKTFASNDFKNRYLSIDTKRINKILGTKIKEEEYLNYLRKLSFEIEDKIKVPSFRHDISSQNDLSEEIARIIGFDNIKRISLKLNNDLISKENIISKIESFFVEKGFSEVINFPFTANHDRESILIDNPLDSNKKNLRTSLKDSLIENLLFNERRQKDSIKLFEISDIYSNKDNGHQEKRLGIIVSGRCGNNYKDFSRKLDKNYLNEVLNFGSDISISDIQEIPRDSLKTKKKDKIYYAEILIEDIPTQFFETYKAAKPDINFIQYAPISEFPSSIRDFSFSISNLEIYDSVISHIDDFQDENLRDSFIFDFYVNEKLKEVKVGIRLVFQSSAKTLSDEDIQKSIKNILKPIVSLDGVFIPGFELK